MTRDCCKPEPIPDEKGRYWKGQTVEGLSLDAAESALENGLISREQFNAYRARWCLMGHAPDCPEIWGNVRAIAGWFYGPRGIPHWMPAGMAPDQVLADAYGQEAGANYRKSLNKALGYK